MAARHLVLVDGPVVRLPTRKEVVPVMDPETLEASLTIAWGLAAVVLSFGLVLVAGMVWKRVKGRRS